MTSGRELSHWDCAHGKAIKFPYGSDSWRISSSIQHVKFLKKQAMLGSHCCIALPLVRIPSNTTYQTKLCMDPISSTITLQTLIFTIKIYHHGKWYSWCGNHTPALKIENSQWKIGNFCDLPTQHEVTYVLYAHQHWISQLCCFNDMGMSPMSQDNFGHPPTTIDSHVAHRRCRICLLKIPWCKKKVHPPRCMTLIST